MGVRLQRIEPDSTRSNGYSGGPFDLLGQVSTKQNRESNQQLRRPARGRRTDVPPNLGPPRNVRLPIPTLRR